MNRTKYAGALPGCPTNELAPPGNGRLRSCQAADWACLHGSSLATLLAGGHAVSDRVRDIISGPLTLDYFNQRTAKGWIVAAVEWRKPGAEGAATAPESSLQEVPYGQRIAPDCGHLVEDDPEMDVLLFIYERVVSGWRPMELAAELNHHGYRTRRGSPWTASAVFDLLPRLIEISPKLQARPDWPARRAKLAVIA